MSAPSYPMAVPLPAKFECVGACSCQGPDGPCADCVARDEARQEWWEEPSISPHECQQYGDARAAAAEEHAYAEGRKDQSEDDAPLLIELKHAHALLMLALKHMTSAQKSRFAADSEAAGIGTEGATRYHERAAAIAAAEGTTP